MENEKAFWYDLIQYGFTDNGNGNGRMLKDGLVLATGNNKYKFFWRVISFNYPDRRQVTEMTDRYFDMLQKVIEKTPWQLHNDDSDFQKLKEIQNECIMLLPFERSQNKIGEIAWRMKTGRNGLLATIAVLRYKKEKGTYPESLEELVKAGYLKELPMDPYSDKPLVYRKTKDNFTIYSVGWNFKDDGGEVVRTADGKIRQWAEGGDTVFWPVE